MMSGNEILAEKIALPLPDVSTIPTELWLMILAKLTLRDLSNVARVSHLFHANVNFLLYPLNTLGVRYPAINQQFQSRELKLLRKKIIDTDLRLSDKYESTVFRHAIYEKVMIYTAAALCVGGCIAFAAAVIAAFVMMATGSIGNFTDDTPEERYK